MTQVNVNPMEPSRLYKKDVYEDPETGSITQYTPVTETGEIDPMRTVVYQGATTLTFSNGGKTDIRFPIPGTSLSEAIVGFAPGVRAAVEHLDQQALRNKLMQPATPNGTPMLDLSQLKTKKQ